MWEQDFTPIKMWPEITGSDYDLGRWALTAHIKPTPMARSRNERGFHVESTLCLSKVPLHLAASNKELTFAGYTRITHQCEASIPMAWFKFKSAIDPEDILIPIESSALDEDENFLTSSIVLDPDTGALYTSFISSKLQAKDIDILPANGYLQYHDESKEYRISNINKLTQQSLPGQYLSLNSEECKSYAEGKLGFGINPGQMDIQTVGNIKHDVKTGKVDLDVMMLVDFFFDNKLIDDMGKTMAENAMGEPIDFERETYQRGLREYIGTDEADKLISFITLDRSIQKSSFGA